MKTIIMAGITGVILFALSASASWYLMNQNTPPEEEIAQATDLETEAGVPTIQNPSESKPEKMAVGIRPQQPITIEALLQLSDSIRKKERELIAREKRVEKSEQNVHLLFEDLKVERNELTALATSIDAKIEQTRNMLAQLKVENQQLNNQTQELAKRQPKEKKKGPLVLDEIAQRVKTARPWFEGLEDEQAANYLKEFANNGDLEFAARLLKSLKERKASKILAAFNDPEFVQQILDALSENKESDGDNTAQRKGGSAFR